MIVEKVLFKGVLMLFKQARTIEPIERTITIHPLFWIPEMLITPKTVVYHGKKVPRIATAAEIMINNLFFSIIGLLKNCISFILP